MEVRSNIGEKLTQDGFAIIDDIFNKGEINAIIHKLSQVEITKSTFRTTQDLFAIRQFLKEVPETLPLIFNTKLNRLISEFFGEDFFVTKSIYFDKPEKSNWFVAYHQDLTISVDKKLDIEGFGGWTAKQNQFAVQPPLDILKNNFTIRIHLDDTDENNGALKVVPGSHLKGVHRIEDIGWIKEIETFCNVKSGGVMIMKPLLFHASNRTTNNSKRRVIHIEFSNSSLPNLLQWSEKENLHFT